MSPTLGRARSYLFVPADRPERIEKARASGADVVVVDLEDAVALGAKAAAREALARVLDPGRPVVLRINGIDTPWFADDSMLSAHPGVSAVMCPKADGPEDIAAVRERAGDKPVIALIETARAMAAAALIAAAPGVARVAFGSIDFQLDLDIEEDDEALRAFRSHLVLVSRLANLPAPIDGVTVAFADSVQVAADARRAREFGFGGKLCIHPRQVLPVNAAFSPSAEQLQWARRVVEASGASPGAAVAVDGKMVDAPVLARARRLLSVEYPT